MTTSILPKPPLVQDGLQLRHPSGKRWYVQTYNDDGSAKSTIDCLWYATRREAREGRNASSGATECACIATVITIEPQA